MSAFRNSILLVVFNYSNCVSNKDLFYRLYKPHFKHVIFYADHPATDDTGVNYVNIVRGCYVHAIFKHFYDHYRALLEECDGLFYTMDDNIINLNILNLHSTDKILYYYHETKPLDHYSGWHWDNEQWGKKSIRLLLQDAEFSKYGINTFSGAFSDWFYLPKRYLTDKLFHLFELFAKHNVFLELSIPSIIHNIEPDRSQYASFDSIVLWNSDRENLKRKAYVRDAFFNKNALIVHPIKFNDCPASKEWLVEFFCKDKCVIITTINKPTETILKHIANPSYDVIIVGDNKTPDDYKQLDCIYLDIPTQKQLFGELADLLPYNHYCRKNLGYLYAVKRGYSVIYETDDDNIPHDDFDSVLRIRCDTLISETSDKWINIFKYFTNNAYVWPRGYPLSKLKSHSAYHVTSAEGKQPSIINGLVENDPDVDAIFRLVCTHQDYIHWDSGKSVIIDNNNVCPFNTQNTFWINPALFACLLIPTTVSFRYCDILRGIITNIVLKHTGNYMMYSSPNVVQRRNEHNLIHDFKSEIEMYLANEEILGYIDVADVGSGGSVPAILHNIYQKLMEHNIVKPKEIEILRAWLSYF